jgi:hypothetical protein
MPNRIVISRDSKPIPCELCGWETLHVAGVFSDDGTLLARTMVCTACRSHHYRHRTGLAVAGVAAGA